MASIIALLPNPNPHVKDIYALHEVEGMDGIIHPLSAQTSYFDPLQKEGDNQDTNDGSAGRTVSTKDTTLNDNANNEKMVIITFDDGWESQYKKAKPILDNYNFKATFYVIGNDIEKGGRLGWQELKQLQNEEHEIGSHSMSHVNLDKISPGEQEYDIAGSKKY